MSGVSKGRILIDGYNLSMDQGTGIATYARNLSREAHALGYEVDMLYGMRDFPADPLLQEIAFYSAGMSPPPPLPSILSRLIRLVRIGNKPLAARPFHLPGQVVKNDIADRLPYFDRIVSVPALFEIGAFRYTMRQRMQAVTTDRPVDIAHFTYPVPVRVEGARNICTIHDLIPLRLPYTTTGNKSRQLSLFRLIAATADHIVTVSEHSKRDIVELLGIPAEKVTNTYQSVDIPQRYRDKSGDEVKAEVEGIYGLPPKGYFLFYGALEPKKNVGRLIEAYCSSGVDAPLVIAGKLGWLYDKDLQLIEMVNGRRNAEGPRILRLDYVPQSILVSLIRGARAVLFPSLYEGFGLAVLEAMQLGTPVLTSTTSSLPEVAGDAALLADPYDVRDIANGIRTLWHSPELCRDLAAKGEVRAADFSPEAHRRRLGAVYDRLLGRSG